MWSRPGLMWLLFQVILISAVVATTECLADSAATGSPVVDGRPNGQANRSLIHSEWEEQSNIYRHHDIYFIMGRPDTKVQLSLKLKVLNDVPFFVGYRQVMFWELLSEKSSPFTDITFNPETFYTWTVEQGAFQTLSFGLEHRSNGEDGIKSRSLDRVFLQGDAEWSRGLTKLTGSLRLFGYYDLDTNNGDVRQYTGFFETRMRIASLLKANHKVKNEWELAFFSGGKYSHIPHKGGLEISYKIRYRIFGMMPFVIFQAYVGYMESMLRYEERVEAYRVGFLL